ncbi:hypothetical protein RF11_01856 [Thelohanellus kitauei]|uniref:Uncharacterized protein n=1 Tax=Thelohanellus kitauei TaxID=669202 RepID=A0A0C2MNC9_THEKT|nr:hypothetical protein RF11_01856 [Thelohanellus kitauei]
MSYSLKIYPCSGEAKNIHNLVYCSLICTRVPFLGFGVWVTVIFATFIITKIIALPIEVLLPLYVTLFYGRMVIEFTKYNKYNWKKLKNERIIINMGMGYIKCLLIQGCLVQL